MKDKYLSLSEPGRQFNMIMDELHDPIAKERRRIKEARLNRLKNTKLDLGL